jgi:thymidylate kinase
MLITFSGLDGAGKTTLIQGLKTSMEKQNRTVTVLTMYDHVSLYAWFRSWRGRMTAGSRAKGRTSQEAPGLFYRFVRSAGVRRLVYVVDLLIFLAIRLREEKIRKRVLILDRYFYDSLADVAGQNWFAWLYIRVFLLIVPTPQAPVFVDVTEHQAHARKAEYPLDYLRQRRATYHRIFRLVRRPIIVANDSLDAASRALNAAVGMRMLGSA